MAENVDSPPSDETSGTTKSKRVVFTFDQTSYDLLEKARIVGNKTSKAAVVRDSLVLFSSLQQQAEQGYVKLIVETKDGQKSRELVIPDNLLKG